MAEPTVQKITEYAEMVDALATDDVWVYVDVSELDVNDQTKKLPVLKLLTTLAGAGLIRNGVSLEVNPDGTSLEITADVLKIKAGGVTEAMLAAAVSEKLVTNGDSHDHAGGDGAQIPTAGIGDNQVTPSKTTMFPANNNAVIYVGYVLYDGTAGRLPAGWSSVRNAQGNYTVTHNLGTSDYVVVAMGRLQSLAVPNVYLREAPGLNSFTILNYAVDDDYLSDNAFWFILVRY